MEWNIPLQTYFPDTLALRILLKRETTLNFQSIFVYKNIKKGRWNRTLAHFIEEWCAVWEIKCRRTVVKGGYNKNLNFLCPRCALRNAKTISDFGNLSHWIGTFATNLLRLLLGAYEVGVTVFSISSVRILLELKSNFILPVIPILFH